MKTWIKKEEALKCRSKHPVAEQQKDQHEQKNSLLNMHLRLKIRRNSKDLKNSTNTKSLCPSLAIFHVKNFSFDLLPIMVIGDTKKIQQEIKRYGQYTFKSFKTSLKFKSVDERQVVENNRQNKQT